jgi:hypothetical protein
VKTFEIKEKIIILQEEKIKSLQEESFYQFGGF